MPTVNQVSRVRNGRSSAREPTWRNAATRATCGRGAVDDDRYGEAAGAEAAAGDGGGDRCAAPRESRAAPAALTAGRRSGSADARCRAESNAGPILAGGAADALPSAGVASERCAGAQGRANRRSRDHPHAAATHAAAAVDPAGTVLPRCAQEAARRRLRRGGGEADQGGRAGATAGWTRTRRRSGAFNSSNARENQRSHRRTASFARRSPATIRAVRERETHMLE